MKGVLMIPTVLLVAAIFLLSCSTIADENTAAASKQQYQWDEYGYILYCPCMGENLIWNYMDISIGDLELLFRVAMV